MKKLTVAEYAKLHDISVQAVYKKVDRLKTVEEERNGRYITLIIVDDEGQETSKQEIKPDSTGNSTSTPQDSTPEFKPDSTGELNQEIIEVLKQQLQEKDKQIERLQEENKAQFERFTELLYRSQQLEALTHKLLEAGDLEPEPLQDKDNDNPEKTDQEQPKKKGFFSRLFKKNKGE